MYAHKLRVADGMTVSIVAAQNDTEDEGGLTYIKGNNSGDNLYFYWSMGEYDADGNVVFDGDWRGVNESWTIGQETNHGTYGASGYPSGISQSDRESRVTYVMPVFRWAKGSLAVGGGSEFQFKKIDLYDRFEIIQLVTKPFTYTFYADGGTFSDDGGVKSMERLALIMSAFRKHRQETVMYSPAGRLHQQAESRQERYTMPDSLQRCFQTANTIPHCLPMPHLKPSGHTQTSL